jgi:predicted MPP superfamily phosphohydrolase
VNGCLGIHGDLKDIPMVLRRSSIVLPLLLLVAGLAAPAQQTLPTRPASLKFAVIGDSGTGEKPQYDVADQMALSRSPFPFELVLMLGDNMYGRQDAQDFVTKFERPYAQLLRAGVLFYATLGNHDNQANRSYSGFNMNGERYYSYARKQVRFVVLDSNQMDPRQLAWVDATLKAASEPWKVCYFHHPIYSDGGRHGSNMELRVVLEPLLVKYGVSVVFAGHDHIYERTKPQKGITYFIDGSSGQLAKGDVHPSPLTAAYFDRDQVFMLGEVIGDEMYFEARTRTGQAVDSGTIHRRSGSSGE